MHPLLTLLLAGPFLMSGLATLPAHAAEPAPRVVVATAERTPVAQSVPLTGSVAAPHVAAVSTAIAGRIEKLHADTGDRVAAGAPLATLDSELVRLQRDVAAAAVTEDDARVAEARRRLAEAERLAGTAIPANQRETRAAELAVAEAALARRVAEHRLREAELERHILRAPFAGVVSARAAETGEWLAPGSTLMELVDTRALRLEFPVPQTWFGRIGRDARLKVRLDNETRWRDARIQSVVPVGDPGARSFLLLATLPGSPRLLPGMAAHATLTLATGETGVAVPRDALNRYPDGRVTVWRVLTRDGQSRVREQRVTVQAGVAGARVPVQGLAGGETLVVQGNEALRHDLVVDVVRR